MPDCDLKVVRSKLNKSYQNVLFDGGLSNRNAAFSSERAFGAGAHAGREEMVRVGVIWVS